MQLKEGLVYSSSGSICGEEVLAAGLEAVLCIMYALSFLSRSHLLKSSAPSEVTPTIKVGLPISINVIKKDFC